MTLIRLSLILLVVCARSARAQDVMSLPGGCSENEPQPWRGPIPQLPRGPSPRPGTGSLIGTVREQRTNRPLTGAAVRLQSSQESFHRETGVDSLGAFAIRDLPPGTYKVVIAAIPYRHQKRTIRLTAGQVDTFRITLPRVSCRGY